LFLLARLFLLALRKCRSASWHTQSPNLDSFSSIFSKDVQQGDGPASDAAGQTSCLSRKNQAGESVTQNFRRKTYQRGSRGWRACPW
jgi:hypothetical protein